MFQGEFGKRRQSAIEKILEAKIPDYNEIDALGKEPTLAFWAVILSFKNQEILETLLKNRTLNAHFYVGIPTIQESIKALLLHLRQNKKDFIIQRLNEISQTNGTTVSTIIKNSIEKAHEFLSCNP